MMVDTLTNGKFHISTMKENPSISVTILLAYLILAIGGKEVKCIRREENTSGVPLNQKVNKTILVSMNSS